MFKYNYMCNKLLHFIELNLSDWTDKVLKNKSGRWIQWKTPISSKINHAMI